MCGDTEALVQQAIKVLNEALAADPEALQRLFTVRALATTALTNHPTIQVIAEKAGDQPQVVPTCTIGVMGLINGLFGVGADGWGKITSTWDDTGNLVKFSRTIHNHHPAAVNPVLDPAEAAADKVADEHDAAIRQFLEQLRIRIECANTELQDAAVELAQLNQHAGGEAEDTAIIEHGRTAISAAVSCLLSNVLALRDTYALTKTEFEEAYARKSSLDVLVLRQSMTAVPCACGEITCQGWRMANRDRDSRIDPATGQDMDAPLTSLRHSRCMTPDRCNPYRLCLLPTAHDGPHRNGSFSW
jgi:hypothetical protein